MACCSRALRHSIIFKVWYTAYYGCQVCLAPYLVLHYQRSGLSPAQVGFLLALQPWVSAPSAVLWSWLADRLGRHKLVMMLTFPVSLALKAAIVEGKTFLFFVAMVAANEMVGNAVMALADTAALSSCRKDGDYGGIRQWGAVGWGGFSYVAGWMVHLYGVRGALLPYWALGVPCVLLTLWLPMSCDSQQLEDVKLLHPGEQPHLLTDTAVAAVKTPLLQGPCCVEAAVAAVDKSPDLASVAAADGLSAIPAVRPAVMQESLAWLQDTPGTGTPGDAAIVGSGDGVPSAASPAGSSEGEGEEGVVPPVPAATAVLARPAAVAAGPGAGAGARARAAAAAGARAGAGAGAAAGARVAAGTSRDAVDAAAGEACEQAGHTPATPAGPGQDPERHESHAGAAAADARAAAGTPGAHAAAPAAAAARPRHSQEIDDDTGQQPSGRAARGSPPHASTHLAGLATLAPGREGAGVCHAADPAGAGLWHGPPWPQQGSSPPAPPGSQGMQGAGQQPTCPTAIAMHDQPRLLQDHLLQQHPHAAAAAGEAAVDLGRHQQQHDTTASSSSSGGGSSASSSSAIGSASSSGGGVGADASGEDWSLWRLLSSPRVLCFLFLVGLIGFGLGLIASFSFLLLDQMHGSEMLMGLTLTVNCLAEVPVFQFQPQLLQLVRPQVLQHMVVMCTIACSVGWAAMPWAPTPWACLMVELVRGAAFALEWGLGTLQGRRLAPRGMEATMQSLVQGVYYGVGGGLGSCIGGLLSKAYGYQGMFFIAAVVIAAGWLLHTLLEQLLFSCYVPTAATASPATGCSTADDGAAAAAGDDAAAAASRAAAEAGGSGGSSSGSGSWDRAGRSSIEQGAAATDDLTVPLLAHAV